jgi:hypothetical protein
MSPPLIISEAEVDTAVRLFTEAVAHVAGHEAEDVEELEAEIRAGLVTEGFGASGR